MKEYLTVTEAAALAKVSQGRIRVLLQEGKLPGEKFADVWRIKRSDLEAWIASARKGGRPTKQVPDTL